MKGNIKKLAVILIIVSIATLIAVAVASANDRNQNAIMGTYVSTAMGSCLIAPCGFDATMTPIFAEYGAYEVIDAQLVGVWRFMNEGKGLVTTQNSNIQVPSYTPTTGPVAPYQYTSQNYVPFTYQVTDDGKITIVEVPGFSFVSTTTSGVSAGTAYHLSGWSAEGYVSPDGKTITLHESPQGAASFLEAFCGAGYTSQIICASTAVLIKQAGY
jgi:hypothetical protein